MWPWTQQGHMMCSCVFFIWMTYLCSLVWPAECVHGVIHTVLCWVNTGNVFFSSVCSCSSPLKALKHYFLSLSLSILFIFVQALNQSWTTSTSWRWKVWFLGPFTLSRLTNPALWTFRTLTQCKGQRKSCWLCWRRHTERVGHQITAVTQPIVIP